MTCDSIVPGAAAVETIVVGGVVLNVIGPPATGVTFVGLQAVRIRHASTVTSDWHASV
jgi:hypothetical protein